MMRKIVSLLILIIFLIFSPNIVMAQWACTDQIPPGCSVGNDCQPGYSCKTNYSVGGCTCQADCKPNLYTCTTKTECCSGNCSSGVCRPACKNNGSSCSTDNECCSDYCAETTCATRPTCRSLGQSCGTNIPCCDSNVCWGEVCKGPCDTSLPLNYCENVCTGVTGMAVIWCAVNDSCYRKSLANRVDIFKGVAQIVGDRYCPGSGPTPTSYCHPVTCYNAPNATYCPNFTPGANCGYEGSCDNCGGVDCGWCGGVTPGGPTPDPGCTDNCQSDPRYLTTCYNQTFGICANTRWCYGSLPNDCACAANTCVGNTCIGTCGDICQGTKVDDSLTYCGAISRQYSETPQTTGTVWSRVEGCSSSVDEVFFPTWNTYGGQDDIVWYPGTKNGGNWEKYIDISQHQPTLGNTIAVHVYDDGFCRPVGASREFVGATTILVTPKTCSVGVSNANSSQGKGVSIITTGNAHINPGFDIVRSWISAIGNSVIPGGVTYDYGGNTGINAVLSGNNFYELVNTNLTSTNSNTTSSSFVVHAPPGTYRVHCDVPSDLDGNYVKCSGNPNCSVNGGSLPCTNWKSCSNNDFATFTIVAPPSLTGFTIRTGNLSSYVDPDTSNRNHICENYFTTSTTPRSVGLVATVTSTLGYEEIQTVQIRWKGDLVIRNMTLLPGPWTIGNNAVYTTVVDWTGVNIGTTQGFEIRIEGKNGDTSGWQTIYTDPTSSHGYIVKTPALGGIERVFKVWDCQVPVIGTLYDYSSQSVICTDNWSSILPRLSADVGFNALKFTNTSSPYPSVVMSVPDTSTYSSIAGNGLVWGKNYISVFNNGEFNGVAPENTMGDLSVSGIGLKIADLGRSPNVLFCPIGETFNIGDNVDPYSTNPNARIVYKFIKDQEAWYQVEGAGVKSKTLLQYGVPVTVLPVTSKFLTLGDLTKDNGLVSTTNFSNVYGNNLKDDIGSPKNWYLEQNTNDDDIYNYNYFYNNFYVKAGIGETKSSWGGWVADQIYFVNGDLTINDSSPAVNPNTQTMMIIVSGNITIQSGVTNLDGIYIADGSITAIGDNSAPLTINGMLYAGGSVGLYRSFTDKTVNNTTPAVKVNYSPGLIFNLPPEIMRVLSGWREE